MLTNVVRRCLPLGAVFATVAVTTLGAQSGRTSTLVAGVADAETGQPLEGAEVLVMSVRRLVRVNGMGEAAMPDVPRGVQRVRVRRLGYSPAEVDLAITGDTTGAVFRLRRVATQLGAVRIEADWIPPRMREVESRIKRGVGRFLRDSDLDKDRDRDFQLVLTTRLPGLKTLIDSNGTRVLASTRDNLTMTGVAPCYVTIYIDDILVDRKDADVIRTWDLAAIEFYKSGDVPVRYRMNPYGCGVLLLWSKWY